MEEKGQRHGQYPTENSTKKTGIVFLARNKKKTVTARMSKKLTLEEFISKARSKHGDAFSYEKTEYVSAHKKLTVTCKKHGDFQITPANLMHKQACKQCAMEAKTKKLSVTRDEFIERAKARHGDRYDYSRVVYTGMTAKEEFICKVHGAFKQTPQGHLNNGGCELCGSEKRAKSRTLSKEEFVRRAKLVHGNAYGYEEVEYEGVFSKVKITCGIHGPFYQTPDRHMAGNGCVKCSATGPSTPELEILDFVKTLDAGVIGSARNVIPPFELDVYSEKHRIAVEFHGLYFHSELFREPKYHLNKLLMCKEKGVDLIQVFEDEWSDPVKREIVKSIIRSRFGHYDRRIYARNTKVVALSSEEARAFFDENHIQGFATAKTYTGLTHNEELVSAMILSEPRAAITKAKLKYDLELVRFVSKKRTQVLGGFTKLLSSFRDKSIVTYCDRRLFNASGYSKCGFVKIRDNAPEYYYVKKQNRFSRHGFRKSKLGAILSAYDSEATERENMRANGFYRIYGCGTTTFVLNPPK